MLKCTKCKHLYQDSQTEAKLKLQANMNSILEFHSIHNRGRVEVTTRQEEI